MQDAGKDQPSPGAAEHNIAKKSVDDAKGHDPVGTCQSWSNIAAPIYLFVLGNHITTSI